MRGIKYVSESPSTGYGRAAREYMRQLVARGIPVTWVPMVPGRGWGGWLQPFEGRAWPDDELRPLVNRPLDYDLVILHLQPNLIERWLAHEKGKPIVVMTVWELDRLPSAWVGMLNMAQGVIVPCRWNRDVFRAAGVRPPMTVVPHIAPQATPEPFRPPSAVQPGDFVFYSIAAWRERNAPHLTLEAFLREFRAEDPVALLLKTSRHNERRPCRGFWNHRVRRHIDTTARQIAALRRRVHSTARVAVILDELTAGGIAALHAGGDAYVSLTHGEGWGLGAYEAAWAGKPVVITGHGGQLDFLPPALISCVDYRLVPFRDPFLDPAEPVHAIGASWAEPDLAQAGQLMRRLAADPRAARRQGALLQAHVAEHFDAEAITDGLLRFLAELGTS